MTLAEAKIAPQAQQAGHAQLIEAALKVANLNALRMALYHLTGDEQLLALPTRKMRFWGETWQLSVLAPESEEPVREAARRYLLGHRDAASSATAEVSPSHDLLKRMIEAYTGDEISPVVQRACEEELAFAADLRIVRWRKRPPEHDIAAFKVLIVGAGMAGLCVGMQLERMGVPYTIIDRYEGIGGTWWINTYPDCRVDLLSHHYEFSFEKNWPWKHYFATQPELLAYLTHCAKKYGVAGHTELSTELVAATWDEKRQLWKADLRNVKTGAVRTLDANVIVSATGVFHTPVIPEFEGAADFAGTIMHTSRWNHACDVSGKRVALIGNGSSGVQLMPWLARHAQHLTVMQRTPGWMMEIEIYKNEVPPEEQWLFDNVPYYLDWHRLGLLYIQFDDTAAMQEYDREWQRQGGRVSARHDRLTKAWQRYLRRKLGDNADLYAKSLPPHLPWAQRPMVDSGWYDSLKRPNVTLLAQGVKRLTKTGIVAADGSQRDVDVIVLACGFHTQRYLFPSRYTGRGGMTTERLWSKDGARAYLGMTMPYFPNLFMLYGPNSQPRTISNFQWSEIWARFVAQGVRELLESNHASLEVKQDVFDVYNQKQDAAMEYLIWNEHNQDSYYKNQYGRVGHNMPWRAATYYRMIEHLQPSDYDFKSR